MPLRRGFKAWCEKASLGHRRALGLKPTDALDPRLLATQIGIQVVEPKTLPKLAKADLEHLTVVMPDEWSAVTVKAHGKQVIIINNAHSDERQNNSLAHELSHVLLEHRPAKGFIFDENQLVLDHYDSNHEDEANYFAGALLIPRDALLHIFSRGASVEEAARYFKVSMQLIRMRDNQTGISKQLGYRSRPVATPDTINL